MKKLYLLILSLLLLALHQGYSQCTNSIIDWDYREYFARNTNTIRSYTTLAQSQTQYFALGANRVTITHNYSADASVVGDVNTHTGETGALSFGNDIGFVGNGVITFTFAQPVSNVQFSMFDIDRQQRVTFGATDGVTPRNISLATPNSTVLTISNNNAANARVDASNLPSVANNSGNATVNVTIAGPVTQVTITVTNTNTCTSSSCTGGTEGGEFFIGDIQACAAGSFPNAYQAISQPFAGQPAYVIAVVDNGFYYINVSTGVAKLIFRDPTHTNMNSLAYDPYNRLIYYTYSLSNSGGVNPNEKSLRRYDMNMDTFGVALANVNHLGIPTFGQGVESGAAAYYNGNLYWGIEGHGSSAVESIVWKINLNASHLPVSYEQVYAQDAYSGMRLHDWADFGIDNGVLMDLDGGVNSSPGLNTDFYHQNLLTGVVTRHVPASGVIPRQIAVDWQSNIYNIGSANSVAPGQLALYNGTTGQGAFTTITYNGVGLAGSWGDGAEAFRPHCDFGDAPATYDPVANSPAVNERDTALRLGTNIDIEWLARGHGALANADNYDDGIATVTIFNTWNPNYNVQTSVYNNTGTTATMVGWLDFNNNGVFDAGEASHITPVPSSPAQQNIHLTWSGISGVSPALTPGSYTYLRVRLSTTAMTANDATGWFDNGETEDYRVLVEHVVLPVKLLNFDAKANANNTVRLSWTAAEDKLVDGYEIQRSSNGREWEYVAFVAGRTVIGRNAYESTDNNPYKGTTHYRIRIRESGTPDKYSEIRSVRFADLESMITVSPNPATSKATVTITNGVNGEIAQVRVVDSKGSELFFRKLRLTGGVNEVDLSVQSSWQTGTYYVVVTTDQGTVSKKLIVNK